jgi:hypothetical protein
VFVEGQNTSIELIQPIASDPYPMFLEKGLLDFNHMAIEIDDMASVIRETKKR